MMIRQSFVSRVLQLIISFHGQRIIVLTSMTPIIIMGFIILFFADCSHLHLVDDAAQDGRAAAAHLLYHVLQFAAAALAVFDDHDDAVHKA